MNKISTLIAAATLAIIPLTGANAEYEDPKYYGFGTENVAPAQHTKSSRRAAPSQRIVPAHGKASTRRIRGQGKYNAFVFEGENISN